MMQRMLRRTEFAEKITIYDQVEFYVPINTSHKCFTVHVTSFQRRVVQSVTCTATDNQTKTTKTRKKLT